MAVIRVKVEKKAYIYIHNTLMNTAYYLKEKVLEKDAGKGDGIGLDIMAALTM